MGFISYIREEIANVKRKDPAARSSLEVVLCYPGFHAILIYRVSHFLWLKKLYLLGRLTSHIGRFLTGVEIHPGAQIGRNVFIDHGMGVVIGETSIICDNVTLYHGVTLGGVSLKKEKRHPTIKENALIGAGAKLLGPFTVEHHAQIGANSVVVKDVEAETTVVGIPATTVSERNDTEMLQHDHLGDSLGSRLLLMAERIEKLEAELAELKAKNQ